MLIKLPRKHRVLVVDDEPDVYSVTKLSLRGMKYNDRRVEFAQALTGQEAVEDLTEHPETSVILLDVVMEHAKAGLDACRRIREELENQNVRILLRTGQPGDVPERKVIDEYDLDGYLVKQELKSGRLYSTVRTALKAYEELIELERHRRLLDFVHKISAQFMSFEPLDKILHDIMAGAIGISEAEFGVMCLHFFESVDSQVTHLIADPPDKQESAKGLADQIDKDPAVHMMSQPAEYRDGYLIPLLLHRELGHGWIYLQASDIDRLVVKVMPFLSAHAVNALYAFVARGIAEGRSKNDDDDFYQDMML